MNGDIATINILTGSAAVTAVVSTRVYQGQAPEKATLPYIVVMTDGIEPTPTKSESSSIDNETVTVQMVDLHQGDNLVALSSLVRAALDRYSGTVTAGSYTIDVRNVFFDNVDKFVEHEVSRTVQVIEHAYHLRIYRTPDFIRS